MRIYLLQFSSTAALSRAFERLGESERIASCVIEPELARLRFRAPERIAEAVVHRIYLDGGLRWCSRHALAQGRVIPLPRAPAPADRV